MSIGSAPQCLYCFKDPSESGGSGSVVRFGHFTRNDDGKKIQRYRCRKCGTCFSDATIDYCFRQKKRHLNPTIFKMLSSTNSQRRTALILGINRKTVIRKFMFMGHFAKQFLPLFNQLHEQSNHMQFDDLETFEHTKFKPVSVTLAVDQNTRRILGFKASVMPPKSTLKHAAFKKYGIRHDGRKQARRNLFQNLRSYIKPDAKISSDMNPHYVQDVKDYFPDCNHFTYKGRRGCVTGYGELKRGGHDPLFSLNHTCAMLRANINRLLRQTWCTTKLLDRLERHIAIYALYHNLILINKQ